MIHYTLLPEKEVDKLKKEYRSRLTIFFLFFMSCAVLVGIGSLLPAYIYSYSEEKASLDRLANFQKDRKESGTEDVLKELKDDTQIINRLKSNKSSIYYSKLVEQIINHKPNGLTISSFDLISPPAPLTATSTITAIVQGKSISRESLILFKDRLENDPLVSKVELPVSDLAKSKNIPYSIKIYLIPIK